MGSFCEKLGGLIEKVTQFLKPWAPLVVRITLGFVFIESGWGKLHNLQNVVEFFTDLGIPAPSIQAPFVATVEFVGGICVLLGLFTRLVSVPLAGTMIVALITAKKDDIKNFDDLTGTSEYLYLILLFWLAVEGAGLLSLDHFVMPKFCKKK